MRVWFFSVPFFGGRLAFLYGSVVSGLWRLQLPIVIHVSFGLVGLRVIIRGLGFRVVVLIICTMAMSILL